MQATKLLQPYLKGEGLLEELRGRWNTRSITEARQPAMVVKDVYHASGVHKKFTQLSTRDRMLFFSKKPRTAEFGKRVFFGDVWFNNPFMFSPHDTEQIIDMMPDGTALNIIAGLEGASGDEDMEEMLQGQSPEEYLLMMMDEDAGAWQHPEFVQAIKNAGYDGVISNDPFGGGQEYVIFNDKQFVSKGQYTTEARNPDVSVRKFGDGIYRAYLGRKKVGHAQLNDFKTGEVGDDERYIWKSAVHPDYLRKGIATELYNVIADDVAANGLKLVPSPDTQLSKDAYEFWKARDPESIKGHGKYKAEPYQKYIGREIVVTRKDKQRPAIITRVGWGRRDEPDLGIRYTDVPEGSMNSQSQVYLSDVMDQLQ
jgi:ribosomal protein S18 acetylase RimI-like enzyme